MLMSRLVEVVRNRKNFVEGERRVFSQCSLPALRRFLENLDVSASCPLIATHEGVTLIPIQRIGKGSFIGGAYSQDGFIPELGWVRGHGGREQLLMPNPDFRQCQAIKEFREAWFGGVLIWHFGHFLVESLSRLASPEIQDSDLPILFFVQRSAKSMDQYMSYAIASLGIDVRRVTVISEPVRVERLHAQQPYVTIRGALSRPRRVPICGSRDHVVQRDGLLYLSRSKLTGRRSVANEQLFEDVIQEWGGEVFHPQEHELAVQIDRISRCRLLIALEGSALHSVLLQQNAIDTLCISHAVPPSTFFLLDEVVRGDSSYLLLLNDEKERPFRDALEITPSDAALLDVWLGT